MDDNFLENKKFSKKNNKYILYNKMITIGTDCSGIEAPIQALELLNIPFTHMFSSEIDKYTRESLMANYNPKHLYGDMMIRPSTSLPDIDIYVCGFPCQSFSIAGHRQGFNDKRGTVFFKCLDVIYTKEPKIFILENVKGLIHHDNGLTFSTIMDELNSLDNYSVQYKIMNTKDYGIPQSRSRIFFVGIRNDMLENPFTFPLPTPLTPLENYIDFSDSTNNRLHNLPPRIIKFGYRLPQNPLFVDLSFFCNGTSNIQPNSHTICPCICRSSDIWCVPKNRFANTKELLSLQGFPTDFIQVVSKTQLNKQIGNSMSVNVLVELFKQIFISIKK
jgi:DNA (cytosine-5)-methyltransferase 1